MAEIFNLKNTQESSVSECRPFETTRVEITRKEEENQGSSAYVEVLKILKEAFDLVDITRIIKKL